MMIESRKTLIALAVLAALGAGMTAPSFAQSGNTSAATAPAPGVQALNRDMRASQLIDKQIKNLQGESLGKIEDLAIDVDRGQVTYAILSSGGVLGPGDKMLAVPVSAFRAGSDRDQLALDLPKERIKEAPALTRDELPKLSKDVFSREVNRFYFNGDNARQNSAGTRMASAVGLIGSNVNDRAAHDAGEIDDIVVNFGSGRAYLVMDFDDAWVKGDQLTPLPFSALMFPSRPDLDPIVNVDQEKIAAAQGFDKNKWPDLNAPGYQKTLSSQLAALRAQSKDNPTAASTGREAATTGSSGKSGSSSSSGPK